MTSNESNSPQRENQTERLKESRSQNSPNKDQKPPTPPKELPKKKE
jgi:hypothetical protein